MEREKLIAAARLLKENCHGLRNGCVNRKNDCVFQHKLDKNLYGCAIDIKPYAWDLSEVQNDDKR